MDLNFKTFGIGDPIIILHGVFGSLDNWQTIAKKLAETNSVYIVDQRNHGRSPHFPEMDYATMAEDLKQFMESQWIYHAHIIGHSMGGKVAMEFAMEHPDMIDKLIVVDIAPKTYPPGHEFIFDALFKLPLKTEKDRGAIEAILEKDVKEPHIRKFLMKNLSRDKHGFFKFKMNLEAIHKNYEKIIGGSEAMEIYEDDTLFILGEYSGYVTEKDYPLVYSHFPKAQIETIPQATHWVHADKPKELIQMVQGFIAE